MNLTRGWVVLAAVWMGLGDAAVGQLVPVQRRTNEVSDAISARPILHRERGSLDLQWLFTQDGSPMDLTGASGTLQYYGTDWTESVAVSIPTPTNGTAVVQFRPATTATNGTFAFDLILTDGTNQLLDAYGQLTLIARGGSSTNAFPGGTPVVVIADYTWVGVLGTNNLPAEALESGVDDGDLGDITKSGDTWTVDAGVIGPTKLDRGYLETAAGGTVSNDVRLIAGSRLTIGPTMLDPVTHAALLFIATGGQASGFASAINNDLFGPTWGAADRDPYANMVLAGEDANIWLIGTQEGSHASSLTLAVLNSTNGWDYGYALGLDTTNATSVGDFSIKGGPSQEDLLTSSMFAPFRIDRQTGKVVIGGYTERLGGEMWGTNRVDALRVANNGFNGAWRYFPPSPYGASGNTAAVIEGLDAALFILSQDDGGQGSKVVLGDVDTDGSFIGGWYFQKYTTSGGALGRMTLGYTNDPANVGTSLSAYHHVRFDADGATYFPNAAGVTIAGPLTADGSGVSNVDAATGDSATGFFDAGTIEHERGGLEADVSAWTGLVGMGGGSAIEVDTIAEFNTALSLTGTASGGTVLRGDGAWAKVDANTLDLDDDFAWTGTHSWPDGTINSSGAVHQVSTTGVAVVTNLYSDRVILRNAGTGTGESHPLTFAVKDDANLVSITAEVQAYQVDTGEPIRFYYSTNGSFSTGNPRLLTTDDEGPALGLDADTLDGQHGAFYAAVSGDSYSGVHDATNAIWQIKPQIIPIAANTNLTAGQCWNSRIMFTAGNVTATVVQVEIGMELAFVNTGDYTNTVDVAAADVVNLDGTALAAGDSVDLTGAAATMVFTGYGSTNWWGGSDGNATDGDP